jgi:hypothetical protein
MATENPKALRCQILIDDPDTSSACEVCFSHSLKLKHSTWIIRVYNPDLSIGDADRDIHVCNGCCGDEVNKVLGMGIEVVLDQRYNSLPILNKEHEKTD